MDGVKKKFDKANDNDDRAHTANTYSGITVKIHVKSVKLNYSG
jgi:hypothetical protein